MEAYSQTLLNNSRPYMSCILEMRVRQGGNLIDSWETAQACAMGGAGVVFVWHGSRYRKGRIVSTADEEGRS